MRRGVTLRFGRRAFAVAFVGDVALAVGLLETSRPVDVAVVGGVLVATATVGAALARPRIDA